ncbi:MAG: response regulator transcription factor [bacterium]
MQTKKILIIEDSKELASQLHIRLEKAGYSVTIAPDGNLGLFKARELNPDLIILDLMLPQVDGYQLCRLLKFDREYEHIPVIVLTARSLDQDRELAVETGADAFFLKPVDWNQLRQTIENLLQISDGISTNIPELAANGTH